MRDRAEQILKILCAVIGLILAIQLAHLAIHPNPLAGVTIPDLPSLPAETNAVATVTSRPRTKPDTNNVSNAKDLKTNATLASADTNTVTQSKLKVPETNNSTSALVSASSTSPATNSPPTNTVASIATNNTPTNAIASNSTNTTAATNKLEASTNAVIADRPATNKIAASVKDRPKKNGNLPPGIMAGPAGGKAPKLAPEIQARVNRITESEILGPVIHPMPMALLGIAGNVAFLRSPSGQTGLVKEGEDLGEIKLLRIGVNRVLVEQNGEKKELMIFAGLGGESLLPKSTPSSNETTTTK